MTAILLEEPFGMISESVVSAGVCSTSSTERISCFKCHQRSQIIEDTIEPLLPVRDINLKAYIANNHDTKVIRPEWELSPDHASHCCQVERTVTLPLAPPGRATTLEDHGCHGNGVATATGQSGTQ